MSFGIVDIFVIAAVGFLIWFPIKLARYSIRRNALWAGLAIVAITVFSMSSVLTGVVLRDMRFQAYCPPFWSAWVMALLYIATFVFGIFFLEYWLKTRTQK